MNPDGIRDAPSPSEAPSPPEAAAPGRAPSPARYGYLVGRLRSRQITIEEATELFEIQQRMIVVAAAPAVDNRPRSPEPPPAPSTPGTPSSAKGLPRPGDDALWEALPVLAAGAGILAAVLKRAGLGPTAGVPPPAPSAPPPSRSRDDSRSTVP